jgi:sugar phosphate isomerase/epimerase
VSTLGSSHIHNHLLVHRGDITRSYIVYLLDKATLCFVEDKTDPTPNALALKGRIFTNHIKDVVDGNEQASGLVVNVQAGEVRGDRFTLKFGSPMERDVWKAEIRLLVAAGRERSKNNVRM